MLSRPNQPLQQQNTKKIIKKVLQYYSSITVLPLLQTPDLVMYAAYVWIIARFASRAAETAFYTKNWLK